MFRKILQSWLESWGYQVTVAEDGAQAWQILQQISPPHLLILDWIMPVLEGPELCRRIRSLPDGARPHIVRCGAVCSSSCNCCL